MRNFEFDGEKYSEASAHQKEWGAKLISELKLTGNEIVLDLGCGDGSLTEKLAEIVLDGKVLGIDSSQGMINKANELERSNLKFERMDINELNFENEFDLIVSNAALHWIKDHKKLLSNCYNALKPGGIIRFSFAGEGNCSHLNKVLKEVMKNEKYKNYFDGFEWPWYMPELSEYKRIVKESNFCETRVWGENKDTYFPNSDALVKWIDQPSIVPFLNWIAEEHRKDFRDIVVNRMLKETKQKDETYFETFRRINIYAKG